MKKQSWFVLALVLCVGLGGIAGSSHGRPGVVNAKQADAAYRDGSYQAKIDVENGRRPHLSSGRWNTDQDRASFIAGYQQTYRDLADARSRKTGVLTASETAGYRDGMLDGARHRKAAQPFQVSKTENYRNTDREYREAYSNGYQQAYYAESADLRTISQTSGPF
jgi:hypothetical protein